MELVAVDVATRDGTLRDREMPVAGLASWLALEGVALTHRDEVRRIIGRL